MSTPPEPAASRALNASATGSLPCALPQPTQLHMTRALQHRVISWASGAYLHSWGAAEQRLQLTQAQRSHVLQAPLVC